jgi:uroporphyrinogen decarboxylase
MILPGASPRSHFLAAMQGSQDGPVPVGVTGGGIYPVVEARLCHRLGLAPGDHEGLKLRLGACDRWGAPIYCGPVQEEAPFQEKAVFPHPKVVRGIWGTWEGIESYGEEFDHPLREAESVAEIEAYPWPDPGWFDYEHVRWFTDADETCYTPVQWGAQWSDFARFAGGWSPVFSRIMDLCGMQTGLMHMAARPDLVHALVAQIGNFLEEYYRRMADALAGQADVLVFGDDFAGQNGLLLSPMCWREYFLPVWKRLFAIAHNHGMLALMHSCGSVRPVLGDLVDAGLDILEVVQVRARGMDPAELKREFGAHLGFYGGVDVQDLLPHGPEEAICGEVRRLIETLGRGGRYVLAPSHFMMDDVPESHVLALYDEARSYRSK